MPRSARSDRRDERRSTAATREFDYRMAPLGEPDVPTRATFDVDVSRRRSGAASPTSSRSQGLRLAGRATGATVSSGRSASGREQARRRRGDRRRRPPASTPMTRALPAERGRERGALRAGSGARSTRTPPLGHVPIAGDAHLRARSRTGSRSAPSRFATPKTYVEFEGATAYGERSRIPFHVTSARLAGERSRAGRAS